VYDQQMLWLLSRHYQQTYSLLVQLNNRRVADRQLPNVICSKKTHLSDNGGNVFDYLCSVCRGHMHWTRIVRLRTAQPVLLLLETAETMNQVSRHPTVMCLHCSLTVPPEDGQVDIVECACLEWISQWIPPVRNAVYVIENSMQ